MISKADIQVIAKTEREEDGLVFYRETLYVNNKTGHFFLHKERGSTDRLTDFILGREVEDVEVGSQEALGFALDARVPFDITAWAAMGGRRLL